MDDDDTCIIDISNELPITVEIKDDTNITIDIEGNSSAPAFFSDLGDVPNSYLGQGDKLVTVKSTEDGLEFSTQEDLISWGNISGDIEDQTDLQDALDLKYDSSDFNSDFDNRLATKTTSNLLEGSNLYFTDDRARTALSGHTTNYSNPHQVTKTQVGLSNVPNLDTTTAVSKAHDIVTTEDTTTVNITLEGQHISADVTENGLKLNNLGEKSYNSLNDKPDIPTEISELTNDVGFITGLGGFTSDDLSEGVINNYDKVVNLTAGTNVQISGTYPHFTIAASDINLDEKVKLNSLDSSAGYLDDKLQEGIQAIQFDTTNTPLTNAEGLLQWNAADGTLDLGMSGGDVTMQVGQELFMKVRNVSGSTMANGKPVYASGRTGNRPNIYLARSDSETTSSVIGLTTQDILSPADGFVTTQGYVRGIKTNYTGTGDWGTTWVSGDKLYISKTVAGQLTNVEPSAPHHSDVVATVEIVHSNLGSLLVNIDRHNTLEELTDVNGTALTTTGQIPVWNNTAKYFDFDRNIDTEFVPYTGATGDVDLGNHGISGADGDFVKQTTIPDITGEVIVVQFGYDMSFSSPIYSSGNTWVFRIYGYDEATGLYTKNYVESTPTVDPNYFDPMYVQLAFESNYDKVKIVLFRDGLVDSYYLSSNNILHYLEYKVLVDDVYVLYDTNTGVSNSTITPNVLFSNPLNFQVNGLKTARLSALNTGDYIFLDNHFEKLTTIGGIYSSGLSDGFTIPEGIGTRLMWIPSKKAFRVGSVLDAEWNDANIGTGSFAGGINVEASGESSISLGIGGVASGDYSSTFGYFGTASGQGASSFGSSGVASGINSLHFGANGKATAPYATHFGAFGLASGNSAVHFGSSGTSSGTYSTHFGEFGLASGDNSVHFGKQNIADSFLVTTFGRYSATVGSPSLTNWVETDPLTVWGNGTSTSSRSNLAVLYKNGVYTTIGNMKIGDLSLPTARLHIVAGSATAGTSPLKFTSGTLLTTAEAGAIEFLTDKFYGSITTGAARKELTLNDIALTSGRVPFTTTNGRLTDNAGLLFDGTTLTLTDKNIALGTTAGTKIGTATNQKLGFFNATPVVQQTATTDLGVVLSNLGLRAAGTAYPITTSGAVTLGSLTATRIPFAGTAGLLTDSANLTWNGTVLGVTGSVSASTNVLTPVIKTDTSTATDLTITTGAAKTLVLGTAVYKDINMAGALLGKPSVSAPGTDTFRTSAGTDTGIETYAFAIGEKVYGGFELQHDYKEGTDLVFHVHYQIIDAPTGTDNVQFRLTYVVLRDGVTLTTVTTIDTADCAVDTRYRAYRCDFGAITGTNYKIGDQFMFTLERVASDGDAFTGDTLIETAGIHYQVDTLGSRTIGTK